MIFFLAVVTSAFPIDELPARITAILAGPAAANVSWGMLFHSSKIGEVYAWNAHRLFVPASNTKLLMGSAALLTLGANFTYSTKSVLVNE